LRRTEKREEIEEERKRGEEEKQGHIYTYITAGPEGQIISLGSRDKFR
jgi:hypothetical protein